MRLYEAEAVSDFWWQQVGSFSQPASRAAPPPPERRAPPAPPVALLGVPFDHVTMSGTLDEIERMIDSRRPHHLVTANLDYLAQAWGDVELRRILLDAHLVLCDGTPLVWASGWLGHKLPERVAGADLVPHLLRRCAQRGFRPFLLGGAPEVVAQAADRVQAQFPELKLAGYYSPPPRPLLSMDHGEIIQRVQEARPDLLLVSFGCPKAEKWIAMHYRTLGVPVMIGVGATVDFLAGRVRRAPPWMRASGLEWAYRLSQEPGRLIRRYATDFLHFVGRMPRQWWSHRPRLVGAVEGDPIELMSEEPSWVRLRLPRWFGGQLGRTIARCWDQIAGRHCLVEADNVRRMDSAALGSLLWLRRELRAMERQLVLLAPSECLYRTLRSQGLTDAFLMAADGAEARQRLAEQGLPNGFPHQTQPLLWKGELTVLNARGFWEAALNHLRLAAKRQTAAIIDLSDLRYIDSTGAWCLLRTSQAARSFGLRMRLIGVQRAVRNVLVFSGVHQHLSAATS